MTDSWMSADEAAEYLAMTRKALYEAVRRGRIPAYRLGERRLRFRKTELDRVVRRLPLLTDILTVIS